jgi:hypothetical protein
MTSFTTIPQLPAAPSIDGTEQYMAVQNGVSVRVSGTQIASLSGGGGGGGGGGNVPADLEPVNGVLIANGTSAVQVTTPGVTGQVLTSNGPGALPTYQSAPGGTVASGGTGLNNLVPLGGILIANGTNPINITATGTAGQVLTSNGVGVPPTMQNASSSSGTVPNGGTGRATLAAHGVLIGEGTSPINVAIPATAGQVFASNGAGVDPSFQALPTVAVSGGGTGATSLFAHGLVVGNGTSPVSLVSPGTTGQVLTSNGAGADPTFQPISVTVPGGGTGVAALTNHGVVIGQGAVAVHVTTPGTAGQVLTSNGGAADPTFQAVTIPNADVPHGGTGLASLTNHGVLIGQGTSPVVVSGTGTAGQVLTSNGAGADPTFQSGTATYPPLPIPDFQTFLQTAFNTNKSVDWIWGNVLLNAPVVVNLTASNSSFVVNLNGAIIAPSGTYTVNTAVDMVTFTVPDADPGVSIENFRLQNGTFIGTNPSAVKACRNGVIVSCHLAASAIFNSGVDQCVFRACGRSGLQIYGAVRAFDVSFCGARDNSFAGFEMRTPNVGGAGIVSGIHVFGGYYHDNGTGGATNGYGIAATAETSGQEATLFHVFGTRFTANTSAGIRAPSGVEQVNGCHFENNCVSNAAETHGAVWVSSGHATLDTCDCLHSTGNGQTLALDISSPSLTVDSFIYNTFSLNQDTSIADPVAKLNAGAGTMWLSAELTVSNLDTTNSAGGWSVRAITTTATTI